MMIPAGTEITKNDGSSYVTASVVECSEAQAGPDADFDTKSDADFCWMHVSIGGEVVVAKFSFDSLNKMYEA